ncbi:MAG: GNAT family N-acetyltransferase [Verrucomicrobiae bacterium]|nr:GNAT family N-acetyltransferase [Verrucomicrobiae bacterium]
MNPTPPNLRVVMIRRTLENLPDAPLPPGFSLRWYAPGDEAHWLRIHLAADQLNVITPELFREQFGTDLARLAQRQCYAVAPGGEVVGTCTAWFNDAFEGGCWGRVHWLAVQPEYQGRGLGRALFGAACRRLRDLGHTRAYLTTSSARLPAIALYLQFGFEPKIQDANEAAVWQDILARLKR